MRDGEKHFRIGRPRRWRRTWLIVEWLAIGILIAIGAIILVG